MKTKIAIAALILTAITVYLIKRRKVKDDPQPVKKSHHLTDAFSRAKQMAGE